MSTSQLLMKSPSTLLDESQTPVTVLSSNTKVGSYRFVKNLLENKIQNQSSLLVDNNC